MFWSFCCGTQGSKSVIAAVLAATNAISPTTTDGSHPRLPKTWRRLRFPCDPIKQAITGNCLYKAGEEKKTAAKESEHSDRRMLLFFSSSFVSQALFILLFWQVMEREVWRVGEWGSGGGHPTGENLKRHPAAFHLLQCDYIRDSESKSVGFQSFAKERKGREKNKCFSCQKWSVIYNWELKNCELCKFPHLYTYIIQIYIETFVR